MKRYSRTVAVLLVLAIGILLSWKASQITDPPDQPKQRVPTTSTPAKIEPRSIPGRNPSEQEIAEYFNTEATVYGLVTDLDGEPVPNANVHYTRPLKPNSGSSTVGSEAHTKTDANGRFASEWPFRNCPLQGAEPEHWCRGRRLLRDP